MLTAREYKEGIRDGAYAWPGMCAKYLIMEDGGALCFTCAHREAYCILSEIRRPGAGDPGWRPAAFDVNWEDPDLYCDQCGAQIPREYED